MTKRWGLVTAAIALSLVVSPQSSAAQQPRAGANSIAQRLQALEDREAIRALFVEYGRTLDNRDFTAFSKLFAKDSEFAGGAGATAKGPEAIGALLQRL